MYKMTYIIKVYFYRYYVILLSTTHFLTSFKKVKTLNTTPMLYVTEFVFFTYSFYFYVRNIRVLYILHGYCNPETSLASYRIIYRLSWKKLKYCKSRDHMITYNVLWSFTILLIHWWRKTNVIQNNKSLTKIKEKQNATLQLAYLIK